MKPELPPILTGIEHSPRKKPSWIPVAVGVTVVLLMLVGILGRAASSLLSILNAKTSRAVESDNQKILKGEVVERTDYAPGPEGEFHKI